MKFYERLKSLRTRLELNQAELAQRLSIATSTYQYYERGDRVMPQDVITQLVTMFNINPAWLLLGMGEMLGVNSNLDNISIPYYPDVMASAGGGIMNSHEGTEPFSIDKSLIDNPNTEVVINVIGESMEPTLKNGEKILVDINQNNISLKPDKIYVVLTDGVVVVKRYSGRQGTLCIFSSDNKVFQPFTVDLANEDNKVLGVVKGIVYRKMN